MSLKNTAFSCIHFVTGSYCKQSVEIFSIIFPFDEGCEAFNINPRQIWILPIPDQLSQIIEKGPLKDSEFCNTIVRWKNGNGSNPIV